MHPSKIPHTTIKKPEEALRLGFQDINEGISTPTRPGSKSTIKPVRESLPAKNTSPGFGFKWNRPDTDLSSETRRIMESVREEAAKIKLQMEAERDEQARKDGEADELFGVTRRKIAKPKGKAGRYSNVHQEEFKKMDSIANHVSSWKNRFQGSLPSGPSLKRTKSKAGFDDLEHSTLTFSKPSVSDQESGRLENTNPGKRARRDLNADVSSARPISRDGPSAFQSKIAVPTNLPSAITTPTKASLARAVTAKSAQSSKIPSLYRSKSTKEIASPTMAKTEGSNRYKSSLARIGSMKSILHRAEPKYSDDPTKIAAGTHLPFQGNKPNLAKAFPSLPAMPFSRIPGSPALKRVDFTPDTKSALDFAATSPSAGKAPLQRQNSAIAQPNDPVTYPSLTKNGPLNSHPPNPADFSFRSTKTIHIGPATSGLTSPTIRRVRPSGIVTPLPAFIGSVPHGMPNKKRRRADTDDDDDIENHAPGAGHDQHEDAVPRAKKAKTAASAAGTAPDPSTMAGRRAARMGSKTARPAAAAAAAVRERARGILSLGRLNMLARPKERR
jgi:hypothetical protein